ncbi:cell surface protein [Desulfocucumis palustris]|uniref:Cell surface protein n=1 Tax=Desulfocucumis palustris TaxID=1898651 RepID=A0A2L2XGP3_9FIRM|nr:PQQ-binding-like beta-propeller repeat protein [Desulfocucumis palustris]GBF35539.1 cell surface protein [Desulfocucumis palustris]
MPKIFISLIFIFMAVMQFNPQPCYGKDVSIIWKVTGLNKPSSELLVSPGGLLCVPSGNKLFMVDANGKKVLEFSCPGGSKDSRPVLGGNGSVFLPGDNSVQEIKPNGNMGWNFKVQGVNKATSIISSGPPGLLYLPLPSALYAIDEQGNYKWKTAWDSTEINRPWADTKREIIACAAGADYLYVVYGEKKSGYTLAAATSEGEIKWRYRLGTIKSAGLTALPDGSLYVSSNPGKIDLRTKGKVYLFEKDGKGKPKWIFSAPFEELTAPTVSEHGNIYFRAAEYLYAVDMDNGKEVWRQKLLEAKTPPVVDETKRRIYLGTDDERLLALNPQNRLIWDLKLEGKVVGRPRVAAGGVLYVVTDKGNLYKIKDEEPDYRKGETNVI